MVRLRYNTCQTHYVYTILIIYQRIIYSALRGMSFFTKWKVDDDLLAATLYI